MKFSCRLPLDSDYKKQRYILRQQRNPSSDNKHALSLTPAAEKCPRRIPFFKKYKKKCYVETTHESCTQANMMNNRGFFMVNPSHHALSTIARMTPSLTQRGRQPKGASPPLTPNFDLFSDACLRPCSTGRGSTDPERPWLHHYPILSITGFLQCQKKYVLMEAGTVIPYAPLQGVCSG
jgi:hypothetical protein